MNCKEEFSSQLPFWDRMSAEEKETICSHTSLAYYDKGQNIHGNSENCTGVIFVKSGVLRIYMLSEEGKEITLYRLYQGDICMLSASCVMQSITFEVFVDAETQSEVYIISSGAFALVSEQNIYVENFALKTTTEHFSDVMWAMQQILFMSFDRRLAVFLMDELAKDGGDTVRLTQEQIAKYMGSAREVVSRMLKYFSTEKLIEVSRGGVRVIDFARMRKLAG